MATGRMIQRKISKSHDVAALIDRVSDAMGAEHGAYAALLFSWCIAHQDVEGRMHGDPRLVRSDVFPLVERVTTAHVTAYLVHMQSIGLVAWYEVAGRKWLAFPGFESSQPGMRKDREPPSEIPPPEEGTRIDAGNMPADCRISAGKPPAEVEEKRSRNEVEKKDRSASPKAVLDGDESAAQSLCTHFAAEWVRQFSPADGKPPKVEYPDVKAARDLVKRHGLELAKELVNAYLADHEAFLLKKAHQLRHMNADAYRSNVRANGKRGHVAPSEAPVESGKQWELLR
jgi:hypothetical protein